MSDTFPWESLPADMQIRVLGYLPANDIAGTARLVSKAAAEAYSRPEHKILRLSQPVPRHAFERQWGPSSGVWRTLNFKQRVLVLSLTAASGDVDNLETAFLGSGFVLVPDEALNAAARAGHLPVCQWIWQRRQQQAANYRNKRALRNACCEALRGGHLGLSRTLQQLFPTGFPGLDLKDAVCAAAEGCDLATLQQLHQDWMQAGGQGPGQEVLVNRTHYFIDFPTGSRTPDWRSKVEWLEATVVTPDRRQNNDGVTFLRAARLPDAVDRLQWLQQRGYSVGLPELSEAAEAGNMPAVQYLLGLPDVRAALAAANYPPAASWPHLAALQALCDSGYRLTLGDLLAAAQGGQREVVEWVLERPGLAAGLQDPSVMMHAAFSGSLELLMWLRERGAVWDVHTFEQAAQRCSEAALEWLAEQGCPLPQFGAAFEAALQSGDLAMLRCLRRLGFPWGIHQWWRIMFPGTPPAILHWLKEEGCPFA